MRLTRQRDIVVPFLDIATLPPLSPTPRSARSARPRTGRGLLRGLAGASVLTTIVVIFLGAVGLNLDERQGRSDRFFESIVAQGATRSQITTGAIRTAQARRVVIDLELTTRRRLDEFARMGLTGKQKARLQSRLAHYDELANQTLDSSLSPTRLALTSDVITSSRHALEEKTAALAALFEELKRSRDGVSRARRLTSAATWTGSGLLFALIVGSAFVLRSRHRRRSKDRTDHRHQQARYRALIDNGADLVFITDPRGRVSYVSPSAKAFLAQGEDGLELHTVIHPEDHHTVNQLLTTLSPYGTADSAECRLLDRSGAWRDFEVVATDMRPDRAVAGIVLSGRDITERKVLQDKVEHQAMHDGLTGLPNRLLFADRLSHALARAARSGADTAVLYLDLDEFKAINDSMGHIAGDALLREVADRLLSLLRWSDTLCRLGGDEFAILLEETDLDAAREISERVLAVLSTDIHIGATPVRTSASVGIATSGGDEVLSADQILSAADVAMYVAKRGGRNRVVAYDADMQVTARRWAQLLGDLRGALDRQELWVAYQPIMTCEPNRPPCIYGVEALLRWNSPSWGPVGPSEFIPLAEEGGIIGQLGDWVLTEAATTIAALNAQRPLNAPIRLSVNVSVRQVDSPEFVQHVRSALTATGFPAELFTCELTESLMVHQSATRVLTELRSLGVRVALDDFGTGYASLAQLGRLQVDQLKIDVEFVRAIGQERSKEQLSASIVSLGKTLGLDVVAEGVETQEQLDALLRMGCRHMQGYLFGKPMAADELTMRFALASGDEGQSPSPPHPLPAA